MLKKTMCFITVLLSFFVFNVNVFALENNDLSAASAVLYYPDGNEILFEKNSRDRRSMASTTKIMTSLLALETCMPEYEAKITWDMVNVEGTSSGLEADDKIYLRDLVYCMMLESGNDAANSVALNLSDSFEDFAVLMNDRARDIGMKDTSFVTPSGLDDEKHYTTAYDMALLTAEAVENKEFVRICSSDKYKVEFLDSDKVVTLYNHNRLLQSYEGCIGIKTGFTKKSGRCLVSAAERDGILLIAVTLNAGDDWNDHKKMLDYGFSCFKNHVADTDFSGCSVPITGGESASVGIESSECVLNIAENNKEIKRNIYLEKFLYAPVEKGDIVGYVEYCQGEKTIKRIPLTAESSVAAQQKEKENIFDRLFGLFDRW